MDMQKPQGSRRPRRAGTLESSAALLNEDEGEELSGPTPQVSSMGDGWCIHWDNKYRSRACIKGSFCISEIQVSVDPSASHRDIEFEVRADVKMSQLSRTQMWSSTICLKSSNGFSCLNRLFLMVNKALRNQPLPAFLYHTP